MQSTQDFRTLQAITSKTFSLPSGFLNTDLPLPAVWDHHLEHSQNHPLFVYENAPDKIQTITWSQAVRAIHRAAHIVQSYAKKQDLIINDAASMPPVIGVLAVKDTLTSWALINGVMRAGYQVFLISPRNSAVAVAHLLKVTKCTMVFVSGDKPTHDLAQDAMKQTEEKVFVFDAPQFADLYKEDCAPFDKLPPYQYMDMDRPALIAHSSGSTSFPKSITVTFKALARWALLPYFGEVDLCGKVMAAHSIPMFHIMGVVSVILWTTGSGVTMATFKPEDPPIIPTADRVLAGAMATKATMMFCVPSFIEDWSCDPNSFSSLKSLEVVMTGGGPLQKQVGDMMVDNGVNIRTMYGATEFGISTVISTTFFGKDWEYFELSSQYSVQFEPQDSGDDTYEPTILSGPKLMPCVNNVEIGGSPAYATNDLLVNHSVNKSLWKVYGRADDQIMHSTGEKTNPGPMEAIILGHPAVHGCLMFGRAQLQTGILVEPVSDRMFDPEDHKKLAEFRNEIWSIVEKANNFAPTHSKIFKEMIIVADPSRPLQYTAKGTPRRQITLKEYANDILEAYKAVAESSQPDIPPPASWELNDVVDFVRIVARKALERSLGDEDDLFQHGADSLQATSIRNTILRACRDSSENITVLPQNLVYAHPTVASLARYITQLVAGDQQVATSPASVTKEMKNLLAELTQNFPKHSPSKPATDSETIMVTGTTGILGSYILNKIMSMPSVRRIYALNRPDKEGKKSSEQRQARAFEEHGLDSSVLDSPKLIFLEGDTTSANLGLSLEQYDEIIGSVTTIIHNAWRVDFNVSLSSFKPLVRGVRNLVDFSLTSPLPEPPRIVFISTIGTIQSWKEPKYVPEAVLEDPSVAVGSGYGESKWVSERILDAAYERTPLRPVIVRVGQLCGSTINGSWNPWEWFPAIVQSYKAVGCLPNVAGMVTWVPIDTAAATIVDMRASPYPFVNLVHPKPVPFSTIIFPLSKSLGVPAVSYAEWLAKLEEALEDTSVSAVEAARKIPALRLIEFYRAIGPINDPDQEAFTKTRLEVDKAVVASKTLGDPTLPVVGTADAEQWLGYWKAIGVLKK